MKYTGQSSDEPTESYAEYKEKRFNQIQDTVDSLMYSIANSSLKPEDKKLILVRVKSMIEEDLFTKF